MGRFEEYGAPIGSRRPRKVWHYGFLCDEGLLLACGATKRPTNRYATTRSMLEALQMDGARVCQKCLRGAT